MEEREKLREMEREKLREKWKDKEKDDAVVKGFTQQTSVLEAAMVFIQALSQVGMQEEDRLRLCDILSHGFNNLPCERMEKQASFESQKVQNVDRNNGVIPTSLAADIKSQATEKTKEEDDEHLLLSFLHKAVEKGGLVLNNVNLVRQVYQDMMHEERTGRNSSVKATDSPQDARNVDVHQRRSFAENLDENGGSKERENFLGPLDNGSLGITRNPVSKAATAPRQREKCPLSDSPCDEQCPHMSQNMQGHPTTLSPAEGKAKVEKSVNTPLGAVNFTEFEEGFHSLQNVNSKSKRNIACPYSDIVKYGSKNFSLQKFPPKEILENQAIEAISTESCLDDSPILKVKSEVLNKRLCMLKFSIIGRISLTKGDKPWHLKTLKEKLQSVWKLNSAWRLISLGRGFFHIFLHSQEEWDRVWSRGTIFLKPGVMRLQKWSLDFNPLNVKSTNAQVWCRIFNLPWGLWDPEIIAGIARKVGTPLKFDKATLEGDFGHFARVLVDLDLSKPMKSNVLIECGKCMIEVKVVPENTPSFCRNCTSIGHNVNECRINHKSGESLKPPKKSKGGVQVLITSENVNSSTPPSGECSGSQEQALTQKDEAADCSMLADSWTTSVGPKGRKRLIKETISDFRVQSGNEMVISNTFSPLVEITSPFDCNEEIMIDDNGETDLPKLSPHVKEKWSNIMDDEEEVVTAPVPFDGLILPPSCMTEVDYTTREALISRSFGSTSTTPLYGQWLQAAKKKSKKGKTGFIHKPVRNV